MTRCVKCKSEYEDHVKTCSKCGKELMIEKPAKANKKTKTMKSGSKNRSYELLVNCKEENEANALISILESNNILTLSSYKSSGIYMNLIYGYNFKGFNVFVAKGSVDDAKLILKVFKYNEDGIYKELDEDVKAYRNRGKRITQFFLWLMLLLPLLLMMFFNIIDYFLRQ